jgi:hypothetical protein
MGRRKVYITEEQKIAARKKRQMDYYWKNQETINKKNLERYHQNKP